MQWNMNASNIFRLNTGLELRGANGLVVKYGFAIFMI